MTEETLDTALPPANREQGHGGRKFQSARATRLGKNFFFLTSPTNADFTFSFKFSRRTCPSTLLFHLFTLCFAAQK